MTPEEEKQYREEAEKLFPHSIKAFIDVKAAWKSEGYIVGRSKSSAELSALREEVERLRKENEWVSVDDRLPEDLALGFAKYIIHETYQQRIQGITIEELLEQYKQTLK